MLEQNWIKSTLKQRGLKLKDAAKRLNVSPPRMTDIIRGMREVQADEVLPLADMLGVNARILLVSLAQGELVDDHNSANAETIAISGYLTGKGKVRELEPNASFRHVPLPPDATTVEGLACYIMGDRSMDTDIAPGSLLITADPRSHFYPITPGALLLIKQGKRLYLRRFHQTDDGRNWLITTGRLPDPRHPSFRLITDPMADLPRPEKKGKETETPQTASIDDIVGGVLWVHQRHMPQPT